MIRLDYDKSKDKKPQETILEIQKILRNCDLFPVVKWQAEELSGVTSNRVTLFPTSLGTNGKGTDELYAMASGLAELMERIENGILGKNRQSPRLKDYMGFSRCPDEVAVTIDDLIRQDDPFLRHLFRRMGSLTYGQKKELLRDYAESLDSRDDGKIVCVPYIDVRSRRQIFLPVEVVLYYYGSNGMAAGNTPEEAMVQGLCEVMERYANRKVIDGMVPPEVPRGYLAQHQTAQLIDEIERSGRYKVSVRDCSLGRGFPVLALLIVDQERGKFGVKFASHPSFEVCLERTLTEAFQGKRLEVFTSLNWIDIEAGCTSPNNYPNLLKVGAGGYPISFLCGEPSYPFQGWDHWKYGSNLEMLKKLLRITEEEGFEIIARDSSHLGFPAYQFLVPGMSEMYTIDSRRIREMHTQGKLMESFLRFPDLTREEENRLLVMIEYKRSSIMENTIPAMCMLPLNEHLLDMDRIKAYLKLRHGEFEAAREALLQVSEREKDPKEKQYYLCLADYAYYMQISNDRDVAMKAISQLYPADTSGRVMDELNDEKGIAHSVYPGMKCFDCGHCPYAGKWCEYPECERIQMKIKKALSSSTVSQSGLIGFFETEISGLV